MDDAERAGRVERLDPRTEAEWAGLAERVIRERRDAATSVWDALDAAAGREPQSPVASAYRLWIADGLAGQGRYREAVDAYDAAIEASRGSSRLIAEDPAVGALYDKAAAAALAGDTALAISTYLELGGDERRGPAAGFKAAYLTEIAGDSERAAELYDSVAGAEPSARTDDPAELARRSLMRLKDPDATYAGSESALADRLVEAIREDDSTSLQRLLSESFFAVGPMGGHTRFESPDLIDEFLRDFRDSEVTVRRGLLGSGDKRYLSTSGWRGRRFQGDVALVLLRMPQGWQWTGVAISAGGDLWHERWRPPVMATNQPLPFELLAPWPAGTSFMAGGVGKFAAELALGPLAWAWLSRSRCGFGPRGFYYNQWPTHVDNDAFAIDFTRYRRYAPFIEESEGTPVLAARSGTVRDVHSSELNGSWTEANFVEISHPDPSNPANTTRFTTKYLHLEGPYKIPFFKLMPVYAGNRLGTMDDTGNSLLDHLHFSIHDNAKFGASIRPTPLSGVRLEDGDSGTCVMSTNIEYVGAPTVNEASSLLSQHSLIVPAALAVNEAPPSRIEDQRWILVLSGNAAVDFKGSSNVQWLRDTFLINPDASGALNHAIDTYGIPRPPGTDGLTYWTGFAVEQWVPSAGLSQVYDKAQSIDAGFGVEEWRLQPFISTTDAFTNAPLTNVFAGMQVDLAVRDTDAWLNRVSYHITLLGKIVFAPIVIT